MERRAHSPIGNPQALGFVFQGTAQLQAIQDEVDGDALSGGGFGNFGRDSCLLWLLTMAYGHWSIGLWLLGFYYACFYCKLLKYN